MLAKIINHLRNSYLVYHFDVSFHNSGSCVDFLNILWRENLIRGYQKLNDGKIKVSLKYYEGRPICTRLVVLSRPRDRIYLSSVDLYRLSNILGVLIVSTPKGVVSSHEAIRRGDGGEVLAYVG